MHVKLGNHIDTHTCYTDQCFMFASLLLGIRQLRQREQLFISRNATPGDNVNNVHLFTPAVTLIVQRNSTR